MTIHPLVFRDNSEWLRWVLLAGAVGMGVLAVNGLMGGEQDIGKIIGGTLGGALLAFSGYVLQVRRVVLDPMRRDITITSAGLRRTTTETIRFEDVTKLLLLLTYDRDENLLPANQRSERWSIVFIMKDRTVPVNVNPYVSKEQALRAAKRIQALLHVEISDNVAEGIAHLAQSGRIIDAVITTTQTQGMDVTQAREYVKTKETRSTPSVP